MADIDAERAALLSLDQRCFSLMFGEVPSRAEAVEAYLAPLISAVQNNQQICEIITRLLLFNYTTYHALTALI